MTTPCGSGSGSILAQGLGRGNRRGSQMEDGVEALVERALGPYVHVRVGLGSGGQGMKRLAAFKPAGDPGEALEYLGGGQSLEFAQVVLDQVIEDDDLGVVAA